MKIMINCQLIVNMFFFFWIFSHKFLIFSVPPAHSKPMQPSKRSLISKLKPMLTIPRDICKRWLSALDQMPTLFLICWILLTINQSRKRWKQQSFTHSAQWQDALLTRPITTTLPMWLSKFDHTSMKQLLSVVKSHAACNFWTEWTISSRWN